MAKPEDTPTNPPMPQRRGLLGGCLALAGAGAPAVTLAAPVALPAAAGGDAALVALVGHHLLNLAAYNAADTDLEYEADPLWRAYRGTLEAISASKPQTMAGILAKARAAKAEARNQDGSESPSNCMAEAWAWDAVNDLLRLHGGAA